MKNAVFWDIKTRSYLTGNILRLRYRAQPVNVLRFEVFTAVTMKNAEISLCAPVASYG
jgi:hypothetical protein